MIKRIPIKKNGKLTEVDILKWWKELPIGVKHAYIGMDTNYLETNIKRFLKTYHFNDIYMKMKSDKNLQDVLEMNSIEYKYEYFINGPSYNSDGNDDFFRLADPDFVLGLFSDIAEVSKDWFTEIMCNIIVSGEKVTKYHFSNYGINKTLVNNFRDAKALGIDSINELLIYPNKSVSKRNAHELLNIRTCFTFLEHLTFKKTCMSDLVLLSTLSYNKDIHLGALQIPFADYGAKFLKKSIEEDESFEEVEVVRYRNNNPAKILLTEFLIAINYIAKNFDKICFFIEYSDSEYFLEDDVKQIIRSYMPYSRISDNYSYRAIEVVVNESNS